MSGSRLTSASCALFVVALAPFAVVVACGGSSAPPNLPPPTTATGVPPASVSVTEVAVPSAAAPPSAASAAPPPPLTSASASALAAIVTTDPAQVAAIASAAAGAGTAKASTSGARDLEKGLTAVAVQGAPGMKPDGAMATGVLKEGEHLEWSLKMPPGKCYAVVGFSPTGEIKDLDLHLLSPPFFSSIAGEDVSDDNAPVVGGGPNPMCPVAAVDLPYKVDIMAQKGAGHAAVQLFSKPN